VRRAALLAVAAGALPAPAAAAPPVIEQMVVKRNGDAQVQTLRARAATVRVGRRRCSVAAGTALAALTRSRVRRVSLRDFGSCSRRARDAGGLYVRAIGRDRARGRSGWVYKVGNRLATTGAGEVSGPFGRGRIRGRASVLWFHCRLDREGGCQSTLALRVRAVDGGVSARVLAYDDEGEAAPAAGAAVRSGAASAVADERGLATLALPAGRHRVHAELRGAIRSFPEGVAVR